ncbi:MAG: pantetheine-phosphate adenylyltransferase [Clostridia bacterium]|nr:pantetheine-phosphate adenylyltransferase [Clostridia bacterium]
MKIAIYPGSFDPVTNGHFDIIKRAAKLFDKLVVVVMVNKSKQASFTIDERVEMLRRVTEGIPKVEVDSYTGLLAEYARERHACTVVKGLRAVSDYEYEFQMALANRRLNPNLETVFLPARGEFQFLSSSAVKEIARYGGEISYMVPKIIEKDIAERLKIK